jgi:hypothetical protein
MQIPLEQVDEAIVIADLMTDFHGSRKGKWGQSVKRSKKDRRMGTISEFCLRHAFGMEPLNRNTYVEYRNRHDADVGDNCEVRSTDYADGRLFLHEEEAVEPKLSRNFALIVYRGKGFFRVAGWMPMRVAVTAWHDYEHWKNGKRCPERDCKAIHQHQLLFSDCLIIPDGPRAYMLKLARFVE